MVIRKIVFIFLKFLIAHFFTKYILNLNKIKKSIVFFLLLIILFLPFLHSGLMWWYIIFLSLIDYFLDLIEENYIKRGFYKLSVFVFVEIISCCVFLFISYYGSIFLKMTWFDIKNFFLSSNLFYSLIFALIFFISLPKIRKRYL